MMNLNQQIVFADTVFAQEVDGEMVLLDMNSENYFGLDSVGTDIWKAIEATDVKYQDWMARKEFNSTDVTLHIYLEPKPSESIAIEDFGGQLALELSKLTSEFSDLDEILGYNPLKISFLEPGSFDSYMKQKQQEGADLAHIKPPHMQPSDQIVNQLQEYKGNLPGIP